ncbi:CapA family protein [Candidatus Dependentiae bacterium]
MVKSEILKIIIFAIIASLIIYLYTKAKKQKQTITIGLAGDTMLGRLVNKKMDQVGHTYIWGNMLPILKKNNLNIVNLETTLTNSEKKAPKIFNFKATPDKVKALQEANVHVVNLANNHMLDFYDEGLIETLDTLDKEGIKHVGAGRNIAQARTGIIIEKNGIKIGVIGYTDYPQEWKAGKNKPGTNVVTIGDIAQIKQDIKNLRKQVDILVLSIHWGPNKRKRPTPEFKTFARQIIDAGVDIIHGHSAHIFQGIEIHNKKIIFYDTGDFVDDYMVGPEIRNDWSFLFQVTVEKHGNKTKIKNLKLIPLLIDNMQVNLATGTEKEKIINYMKMLSQKMGTEIKKNLEIKF